MYDCQLFESNCSSEWTEGYVCLAVAVAGFEGLSVLLGFDLLTVCVHFQGKRSFVEGSVKVSGRNDCNFLSVF